MKRIPLKSRGETTLALFVISYFLLSHGLALASSYGDRCMLTGKVFDMVHNVMVKNAHVFALSPDGCIVLDYTKTNARGNVVGHFQMDNLPRGENIILVTFHPRSMNKPGIKGVTLSKPLQNVGTLQLGHIDKKSLVNLTNQEQGMWIPGNPNFTKRLLNAKNKSFPYHLCETSPPLTGSQIDIKNFVPKSGGNRIQMKITNLPIGSNKKLKIRTVKLRGSLRRNQQ